jgi:hypothetical protein
MITKGEMMNDLKKIGMGVWKHIRRLLFGLWIIVAFGVFTGAAVYVLATSGKWLLDVTFPMPEKTYGLLAGLPTGVLLLLILWGAYGIGKDYFKDRDRQTLVHSIKCPPSLGVSPSPRRSHSTGPRYWSGSRSYSISPSPGPEECEDVG